MRPAGKPVSFNRTSSVPIMRKELDAKEKKLDKERKKLESAKEKFYAEKGSSKE